MSCMQRYVFRTEADTAFIEAIRVVDRTVVYAEEHLQRMQDSLTAAGMHPCKAQQQAHLLLHRAMDTAGVQTPAATNDPPAAHSETAHSAETPLASPRVDKLRFQYNRMGVSDVSLQSYTLRDISRLRLRELPTDIPLEALYPGKFRNRGIIDGLREGLEATEEAVFLYNGYITDAGRASLAFRSEQQWYTPSTPLLPGTTRCRLIREGILQEAEIRLADIDAFTEVSLFSAMLPLGTLRLPLRGLRQPVSPITFTQE